MKTNNLEKRKNNILIATIITVLCYILNALLFLLVRILDISLVPKIILLIILLIYTIFILPNPLLKLQTLIYNYLCKNIDIIENNLSSQYKPVFLNTNCLKTSAIVLHMQRAYFAKLEADGKITIKIETVYSDDVFTEQTSDYSWFLSLFRFEE